MSFFCLHRPGLFFHAGDPPFCLTERWMHSCKAQRGTSLHKQDVRIQLCHLNTDILWEYGKNKTSSLVAIPGRKKKQAELTKTVTSQGVRLLRLSL